MTTNVYEQLTHRGARRAIQLLAITAVAAAAALSTLDSAVARVVAVVLIGAIALAALKFALVSLAGQQRLGSAVDGRAIASSEQLTELESRIAEFSTLAQRLTDEVQPMATLTKRTEPAIAELATLRHEVLYLRETVDRIERSG